MAIPGIITASTALFKRLPDRLFAPLGSVNRHGYWSVLCELHKRRFGPDAPIPPSYGYLQRDIHKDIEDHLTYDEAWEAENGESPDTPLNIRAIGIFNQLHECGWFRVDRYGMEKTVTMAPGVSQLLNLLINFAETGPIFVSGKIRSIDASLTTVINGDGGGDLLREAAEQARHLFEHIRNTGMNVRDLMTMISAETTTRSYIRNFFNEYIEQVFIGDYRELKTKEHPLSRSPQILRTVEILSSDGVHRARLIDWYSQRMASGNQEKGASLFERDIRRLFELERISEYLERLDQEFYRANKRALAFIDYRIRSPRPVDHLIRHGIERLLSLHASSEVAPLFAPDMLISGNRLAEPKRSIERPPASPLRQQAISDRTRALANIMRRAREARAVTVPKMMSYVSGALAGDTSVSSEALPAGTIEEVRTYQMLHSIAMSMSSGSPRLTIDARRYAHGFDVKSTDTTEHPHPYLSGKPFEVVRRQRRSTPRSDK